VTSNTNTETWEARAASINLGGRDLIDPRLSIEQGLWAAGFPQLHWHVRRWRIASLSWDHIRRSTLTLCGTSVSKPTFIAWFPEYNCPPHEIVTIPDLAPAAA
jgi:hypothetical protein